MTRIRATARAGSIVGETSWTSETGQGVGYRVRMEWSRGGGYDMVSNGIDRHRGIVTNLFTTLSVLPELVFPKTHQSECPTFSDSLLRYSLLLSFSSLCASSSPHLTIHPDHRNFLMSHFSTRSFPHPDLSTYIAKNSEPKPLTLQQLPVSPQPLDPSHSALVAVPEKRFECICSIYTP